MTDKRKNHGPVKESNRPVYVDLKTDFGFKTVFGRESSKRILIEFFKQLIPEETIEDITYIDKEFKGRNEDARGCVFDVYCITPDGRRFIVEMQQSVSSSFLSRSVFYATFPIQDMVNQGSSSFDFDALYVISILGEPCKDFRDSDKMITTVQLRTDHTNRVVVPNLCFIYVELPKFNKTLQESKDNLLDGFLYTIKHISEMTEKPKELYNQVIGDLFAAAELAKMSAEEQRIYTKIMTTEIDIRERLKEGMEESMKKGMEKGGHDKALEIANNMIAEGMSLETILRITGLTAKEIEVL